jgi:hypothetical protein
MTIVPREHENYLLHENYLSMAIVPRSLGIAYGTNFNP